MEYKQLTKEILKGVAICALLILIFNQAHSYYYKSYLLQKPCDLCTQLNPDLNLCSNDLSNITINIDPYSPQLPLQPQE